MTIDTEKTWTVKNCRSILAFCLLRQIVRDFEDCCEDLLDSDSDDEINYLVDTLKGILPESKKYFNNKFDKETLVEVGTLAEIYQVANHCLNEPQKALDFSIHNSISYFLEDCGEMDGLEPYDVKVKVLKFFFPEMNIPQDNLESFFHEISSNYRMTDAKSLESTYFNKICKFTNDFVELRYLCN